MVSFTPVPEAAKQPQAFTLPLYFTEYFAFLKSFASFTLLVMGQTTFLTVLFCQIIFTQNSWESSGCLLAELR